MSMTIGGLARAGGVGVETVRYYQRRGLLEQPVRPVGGKGGVRRYGQEDARRLRFIRSAQGAGFTLDQIAALLRLDRTEDRAQARSLARLCLDQLDRRIVELEDARGWLRRLEAECSSGAPGPCPILSAFEG